MAEGGLRKSSRIKSRGPLVYAEDDLDLAYDLHLDISNEIFNVLEAPSKQKSSSRSGKRKQPSTNATPTHEKNKGRVDTSRKNISNISKKVEKYSNSEQEQAKVSPENKCVLEDAKVHEGGDNSANSGEDCSNVSCSVCDTVFVSKKAMEDHMVEIHSDEVKLRGYLICDVCKQMCVNQSVYDKHMKLHSNYRKFKCEICKKAFADSCSLKRHMKSHDDERPYACDLCMKSFRDNPSLSRHQRTHTDRPRMFNCLKCDKNFTDKHTLKRHERTHMSVRPFECETCFKTFCESGSFRRHLRTHSGVRNFICPVCSRGFLEKQSLLRHQKNVCGFGGDEKTKFPSSFLNIDQGPTSHDSDANDSDISRTAVDEKSCVLNEENTSSDEYLNAPKLTFSEVNKPMLPGNSKKCEFPEKSNDFVEPKDAPSLHSLIQKDPDLYNSISEIVESIDSYEKMLDLCGDTGQVEIDAALTREPAPMPENLLCFECGEQLVDGGNFRAKGKSFHPSLCNSYKCFNCEDDDYGDPPVLTAEMREDSPLSVRENCDSNTADEMLHKWQKEKLMPLSDSMSKNVFGTDESLEHLRERLRSQHGVFLFGHAYNSFAVTVDEEEEESDINDQTDNVSSVATSSRSHSIDSEATQIFLGSQDGTSNPDLKESLDVSTSAFGYIQQDDLLENSPNSSATTEGQQPSLSITPKMDYEADDQSIPSVFPCHLCTKVFASSAFLTRHLTLHKNSPHKCMVCSKTFTNSQNLKRHITTHTGEKPYTCPYCSKCFRDPSNFSKHKKACCASQSAPSLDDSNMSASSVSSPQSLDDSGPMSHAAAHVTDVQDKSRSATTDSSASQDIPLSFNYDNDEEEDLPVSFGHPADSSCSSPTVKYLPDCSRQHGVNSVVCEASERLTPDKDVSSTRTRRDEGDVLIPCEICGKMLENEHLLEIHMKYHSSDPRVTCIECGKIFADPFGLKRHLRIHAGIRPHTCEYCGRGYCDNWSLRKHKSRGCMLQEVKVPPDFLHPCQQCTRVFCESDFLEEHLKSHSGLLKFECDICQKRFSEAFNLKRHRRLHMAICSSCDKEFKDVQSLNDHQAHECPVNIPQSTTCKEEGFSCQECGRVYSTKAYLERHKKFHSDLKPYVCEICSKRFSEAFRLRRHLKVHKGERPFSCEICSKDFTDLSSLKRHLSNSSCSVSKELHSQQGTAYFPCQMCDKSFTKNYLLARHKNVHSKERPFTCDECGRTYKDTSSLKRHQLTHQGIKSFICPVCGKDFFYSDSLKRHLMSSCGKKTKPFHHRRGRGKGKRKSNNNINMKDKNIHDLHQQGSVSHNQIMPSKLIYQVQESSQDVKFGRWACQRSKHCWRCNLKFRTAASVLKHSRVHCHRKPFYCRNCFFRFSRKIYLRCHLRTHKPGVTKYVGYNQSLESSKI